MTSDLILLELDHGDPAIKNETRRYRRQNPWVTLAEYLRLYPARAREELPESYLSLPLERFNVVSCTIPIEGSKELRPPQLEDEPAIGGPAIGGPAIGELRRNLDALWREDVASEASPTHFPEQIGDGEAVRIAYRDDLEAVARFLKNELSVLILCDKVLTEHIWEAVCQKAGKRPVLDDAVPGDREETRGEGLDRALQGQAQSGLDPLAVLIHNLKHNEVLVLRSLDLFDSPNQIQTLYQGASGANKSQLLAFLDPSLEVKKVLADRFAVHVRLVEPPRFLQIGDKDVPTLTRLITAEERRRFEELDAEGLYKNVSGLNAVQFRNAMRYIGATLEEATESRRIYELIRQFKTSAASEIDIPDTTFKDIGGYESVKRELQSIIALVSGHVEGIQERQRGRLIPRGFIFHGPPGTGKTLFAKAIANEMNATIQMISGPEIMDKYVGQSESNLRRIFATARRNAPSVVFFDEFDSLASQRSSYSDGGARANNAVVAQLLTELDGFRQDQTVLVIGTTNRLDIIDEALLRPSRLKPIEIPCPDTPARREVARIHAEDFGVDRLLTELCELASEHLEDDDPTDGVPSALLEAIGERFPPCLRRADRETRRVALQRELGEYLAFVERLRRSSDESEGDQRSLRELTDRLTEIGKRHGFPDTPPKELVPEDPVPENPAPKSTGERDTLVGELAELLRILREEQDKNRGFSPSALLSMVLGMVADYTKGFNNDEIRAIFQEASLEHHMEGRLVTPRYLGMKIGMIRQRRDEREVVHLSAERSRRF